MSGGNPKYDNDNIFSKILDGAIPAYKIFETEHALAILDAFPMTPGHSLLIPKAKGYIEVSDMPEDAAANLLASLPRLVRAVRAATGVAGIRVMQNNSPAAGQVVPHVHFHVIPMSDPATPLHSAKSMLDADTATAMLKKIQEHI